MKILLINLDKSTDRLEQQRNQFNELGLEFERLPAVTIHDFTEEDYKRMAFNGQRPMKQSELACFLSHKKAWEYVCKLNEPCVIFEDDVVLAKDFKHLIAGIEPLKNIDHITLEVVGRKKIISKEFLSLNENYKLFRLFQDRNGAGGYVLFPTGAKKLLDQLNSRAIGLADEVIASCRSLLSYQVEPAAVLQGCICPLYDVETDIDRGSVIGAVQNNQNYNLTVLQKMKFKRNRILSQIILAIYFIKFRLSGVKRNIVVNKSKF